MTFKHTRTRTADTHSAVYFFCHIPYPQSKRDKIIKQTKVHIRPALQCTHRFLLTCATANTAYFLYISKLLHEAPITDFGTLPLKPPIEENEFFKRQKQRPLYAFGRSLRILDRIYIYERRPSLLGSYCIAPPCQNPSTPTDNLSNNALKPLFGLYII